MQQLCYQPTEWLAAFNDRSIQKGQILSICEGEKPSLALNKSLYLTPEMSHNINVTQFAVKLFSYTNATTGYLIIRVTCL